MLHHGFREEKKMEMLMLGRHGREGVSERGKTKTETKTEFMVAAEALLKKLLADHQYRGMFEVSVRCVDGESPLQVKFCDASQSAFDKRTCLLHNHAGEVSQGSPEVDINDISCGTFWDGWGDDDFFDSLRKRPTDLPIYDIELVVQGYIHANSCYLPRIEGSVSWSGGALPCCVWELDNLTTNCKRVLLAFDVDIKNAILPFLAEHASDYLVVVVNWDAQSYLFLRKLAQSVPGLTFLAITSLDHHHLDRLTFLAAPPCELLSHYGWDLSKECKLTGVSEDASLDIKWLGLRPSDIDAHVACFKLHAFMQRETDFETVIDRLLTIPTFTKNQAWKDELMRLRDRPLFMAFGFLKPTDSFASRFSYIKDVYLPQKLDQENWV